MTSTPRLPDSFTTTLSVDQSPNEVFAAVLNVRGWWSENIDGPSDQPGELFTYHHQDVHRCTMRVAEMTSPTRVVWHVVDNQFNFTDNANEWKGTEIHFDITRVEAKTELRFTHLGLVPAYECFDVCSGAWDFYLQTSLRGLIRTGKGLPNPLEQPAA
jgi:Activator of Hsp90 ATPase homolog 1-like protein